MTCSHPFSNGIFAANDKDFIIVVDPAQTIVQEGDTLTFVCPPQHVLIGPNITTCMGNGQWEPNPRDVECKGIYYNNSAATLFTMTI